MEFRIKDQFLSIVDEEIDRIDSINLDKIVYIKWIHKDKKVTFHSDNRHMSFSFLDDPKAYYSLRDLICGKPKSKSKSD